MHFYQIVLDLDLDLDKLVNFTIRFNNVIVFAVSDHTELQLSI